MFLKFHTVAISLCAYAKTPPPVLAMCINYASVNNINNYNHLQDFGKDVTMHTHR